MLLCGYVGEGAAVGTAQHGRIYSFILKTVHLIVAIAAGITVLRKSARFQEAVDGGVRRRAGNGRGWHIEGILPVDRRGDFQS